MAQPRRRPTDRAGRLSAACMMMAVLCGGIMLDPPPVAAEGKRVAFVVGIGTYDRLAADKQLYNSLNDAEGMAEKLKDIGFQVTRVANPGRSEFYAAWHAVLDGLKQDDTFLFFYSGHGVQVGGHNYLLPRDVPAIRHNQRDLLTDESVSLNRLLADLTNSDRPHPKHAVVILDACRDDPFVPPEYKGITPPAGLAKMESSDGLFVIYSAASNRTALDRLSSSDAAKYSVFTRVLLPLIGRSDLTIQEMANEVKNQVSDLARNAKHDQRPAYYDGLLGHFCLPGCAASANTGTTGLKQGLSASVQPAVPEEITGQDGARMVLIRAGRVPTKVVERFGSGHLLEERQSPPPSIFVHEDFYIDQQLVTIGRFKRFVDVTGYQPRSIYWQDRDWPAEQDHAIDMLTWVDAGAYCIWAKKRLPTEDEWEKAARDTQGRIVDAEVSEWTSSSYDARFSHVDLPDLKKAVRGSLRAMNSWAEEKSGIDFQVRMFRMANSDEGRPGFRCAQDVSSMR